jgi:hypothetical protein
MITGDKRPHSDDQYNFEHSEKDLFSILNILIRFFSCNQKTVFYKATGLTESKAELDYSELLTGTALKNYKIVLAVLTPQLEK